MQYKIWSIVLLFFGLSYGQTKSNCIVIFDTVTNEYVYDPPSITPEPNDGLNALYKAIRKNVRIETTINIEGPPHELIIVGFIVCNDGKIIGERIIKKSPLPNLEEQVLNTIKTMEWKPGECDGKKVNVLMEFPFRIKFDEFKN